MKKQIQNPSKTIRQLLKFAGPMRQLLDLLDEPIEGKIMEVSGGSNSGKSRVALSLLEEFVKKGDKISFFDLENGGNVPFRQHPHLTRDSLNLFTPNNQKDLIKSIYSAIDLKVDMILIDYINLIGDVDYDSVMLELKKIAKDEKIFIVIITHNRGKRQAVIPQIEHYCDFKIEVEKSLDYQKINMRVVKNIVKVEDFEVVEMPV